MKRKIPPPPTPPPLRVERVGTKYEPYIFAGLIALVMILAVYLKVTQRG